MKLSEGLRLLKNRQYKAVHGQAIELIKANVNDPLPYFLLAIIAEEHRNYRKAQELFDRAVALDSTSVHFHVYRAKLLSTLGRHLAAMASADSAARLAPSDASLLDAIGVVYSRGGDHARAIGFFQQAVERNPKQASYHYNLAASAQFLGDFECAKRAYQQSLALDATVHRAWSSLVALEKQTHAKNHLAKLTALFEQVTAQQGEGAEARLHLGHAIAKTYEDLGDYPQSLDWLRKAKQAKREQLRYDRAAGQALFAAAKQSYSPDAPDVPDAPPAPALAQAQTGDSANDSDSSAPIFIVGLPRTGTTLVDRIVSSHARVVSAGELNIFAELVKEATQTSSPLVMDSETFQQAARLDTAALSAIGRAYIDNVRARLSGLEDSDSDSDSHSHSDSHSAPDSAPDSAHSMVVKHVVDKMPLNFFYAGLIHRALPKARIVALRRGAMDSCLSNYRQLFSSQYSYYNYSFDLEDTAEFYRLYDDIIGYWCARLPSDRFMEIHYEDIIFHQRAATERLLDFCGLEWDEACLHFHENTAPVSTASSVQVRQPLYSGSIGRWKKYGDKLDQLHSALGKAS